MVNLNIRFQLAAAIILLIIIVDFIRIPHLKTLSTKFFICLMGATTINLCTDMITVYTVNNMDTVPAFINIICHQFFVGSVVIVLFMNFMYMSIISHDQRRYKRKWYAVILIPLIISAFVILKREILFVHTAYGSYSYGRMAYVVYVCGVSYLIGVLMLSFDKRSSLTQYQRVSIRLASALWIAFLAIQMIFPYVLLSGLAFTILLLVIYIAFENQKVYMDQEVGGFTRSAFLKMFSEYYEKNGDLTLFNIVFENYGRMGAVLGVEKSNQAMAYLGSQIKTTLGKDIYHSRGNMFTVFLDQPIEKFQSQINRLQQKFQEADNEEYNLQLHIDVIDVRAYIENKKDAYDLMEFMAHKKYHVDCTTIILNQELITDKVRQDRIEALLEHAMMENAFQVHYQPIYDTRENCFRSAEALIRMRGDEELGYISPEEFIPIAEKKGMIFDIGDYVFRETAKYIRNSGIQDAGVHYIEINLSGIQISTKGIDRRLMQLLKEEDIDSSLINLEITETAVVENDERFRNNISALRRFGFTFSMDDFGTGYSNLAQMSKTDFELIKIDKSILWSAFRYGKEENESQSENSMMLLDSVIQMLHNMNLEIVVEGVETQAMAEYLISKNVEYLQGFYYSRPIPGEQFLEFVTDYNKSCEESSCP